MGTSVRQEVFDRFVEEYDSKALGQVLDLTEHRFVSIERDSLTMDHYVKGHKSIRGACSYLARAIEEGGPFVPIRIIDLDSSEEHELDLFVHVAPKSVDAVSVMMPRELGRALVHILTVPGYDAFADDPDAETATKLLKQAIDRR